MSDANNTKPAMTLRQRIEHSKFLASVLARVAGGYLSLCNRTTRWEIEGLDDLRAALTDGPVLLVLWHQRSIMAAIHWPVQAGPLSSLYANSPIGRVSGALQRQRRLQPMEMADGASNIAASRQVLRRFREGVSIGMTGDGPLGPDHAMKSAPLEWASRGPMPVWGYAFKTRRHRILDSWDNMILPLPFTQGRIVFAPFEGPIVARPTSEQSAQSQAALTAFLDNLDTRADREISD